MRKINLNKYFVEFIFRPEQKKKQNKTRIIQFDDFSDAENMLTISFNMLQIFAQSNNSTKN